MASSATAKQLPVAEASRRNGHVAEDKTQAPSDSRSLLRSLMRTVSEQVQMRIPRADLDERDPDFIRERLPLMWLAATTSSNDSRTLRPAAAARSAVRELRPSTVVTTS